MIRKHLLEPGRRRHIPKSFSWVDQRLVRKGHFSAIDDSARALYLFLIIVADAEGLSYYSEVGICKIMGWETPTLCAARRDLTHARLIAYCYPLYQVLELQAPHQVAASTPNIMLASSGPTKRQASCVTQQQNEKQQCPKSIAEIIQKIIYTTSQNRTSSHD
jgi:hypothetical protein